MWPEFENKERNPNPVSPWNRHRNLISGLAGISIKTHDVILNRWCSGMAIQNQNGKLFPLITFMIPNHNLKTVGRTLIDTNDLNRKTIPNRNVARATTSEPQTKTNPNGYGDSSLRFWITTPESDLFIEPIPNQTPEVNGMRFWIGMWPDFKKNSNLTTNTNDLSWTTISDSKSKRGKSHDLKSRKQRHFQCLKRFMTSILNHNPQLRVHWSDSESKPWNHLKTRKQNHFQCLKQSSLRFWITTPNSELFIDPIPNQTPEITAQQKKKAIPIPKAIHRFDSESQPQTPNCSPIRFRIETFGINCRRVWSEKRFPIEKGGHNHNFKAEKTRRFQPLPWPFSIFCKEYVKTTRTQGLTFRKRTSKQLWNDMKLLKKNSSSQKKHWQGLSKHHGKIQLKPTHHFDSDSESECGQNSKTENETLTKIPSESPRFLHGIATEIWFLDWWAIPSRPTTWESLRLWMAIQNQNGKLFPPYHIHDSESQPQNLWAEHWLTRTIFEKRFRIETWQEPLPQNQKPRSIPMAMAIHQFDSESQPPTPNCSLTCSESNPANHLTNRKQGHFQCLKRFIISILNHNPRFRIIHWSDSESNPWNHLRTRKQGHFQCLGSHAIRHFDSESHLYLSLYLDSAHFRAPNARFWAPSAHFKHQHPRKATLHMSGTNA